MVTRRGASSTSEQPWAPDRQEVIWINCNPQAGNEMRDIHPFLVLSPRVFNERTSLVIGLPMATAPCNADNPFAVAVGLAKGKKAEKPAMSSAISPGYSTDAPATEHRTRLNCGASSNWTKNIWVAPLAGAGIVKDRPGQVSRPHGERGTALQDPLRALED